MKIDRLFSIVNILLSKNTVTATELANEFNVSVRTIYRDIEFLSTNGIPIYATQGKGGGISILEGYSIDKTLLSNEEQKQIIMALQSVNATGQVNVKESLLKVANIFKNNEINWVEVDFSSWQQNNKDKEIFKILRDCIFSRTEVSFFYYNLKGEKSNRTVEPYKLVFKVNTWYLYGYCNKRKEMRFFKLTRINDLKTLHKNFQKRNLPSNNYSYKEENNLIQLKLQVNASMGFRVYDEFRNGIIIEKDNYFLVDIEIPKGQWLFSYLLSFENNIKVLEPEEIKEKYIEIVKNIIKNY